MSEANVESHMGPTFYRLTSFSVHVNRPSHSWDAIFFKIWPWKSKVNVMVEVKIESHKVGVASYRLKSISFHVNQSSIPEMQTFMNLALKIQDYGQMTTMLHHYRSRQFIVPTFRLLANHNVTYIRCGPALWRQPWNSHKQTHVDEASTTHGRAVGLSKQHSCIFLGCGQLLYIGTHSGVD